MSTLTCPKCGSDLGAKQFKGICKNCGARYSATLWSKLALYGAIFLGFICGQMIATPLMVQNGISPSSVSGIVIGIMASISAVFVFAAIALKFLHYEWEKWG